MVLDVSQGCFKDWNAFQKLIFHEVRLTRQKLKKLKKLNLDLKKKPVE